MTGVETAATTSAPHPPVSPITERNLLEHITTEYQLRCLRYHRGREMASSRSIEAISVIWREDRLLLIDGFIKQMVY